MNVVVLNNPQSFDFETTHWTMVLRAGTQIGKTENDALCQLCQRYWKPLYAFVRRKGQSIDEAEDAVQSFIVFLLDGHTLGAADRERGLFRTFLLSSFVNYLRNRHVAATRQKRGGGQRVLSLDVRDAEGSVIYTCCTHETPQDAFERAWVLAVLDQAIVAPRERYESRGKTSLFQATASFLGLQGADESYDDVAAELDMTPGAVKVAVHRMRREYRELLRQIVAATVAENDDVQDELQILMQSLRGKS